MGVFFLFLISSFLIPTMILASSTDSEIDLPALLSFKSLISNDPTGLLFSWNETIHYCNWPGVTCGRSHPKRVTSLVLESFQLSGYISPSVGNLTFLQNLSLYDNQFAGNIPEEIGRCRRLRFLDMRINSLDGSVPPTVSNCTSLEVIYLRHNYLQGTIPLSIGNLTSLRILGLSENNFTGEIPSSFEGLQSVTGLGLAVNQLSGEIPAILGQLQFLEILLLEDNNLSGKVPRSIYNLSAMVTLALGSNQLEGTLPPYICETFLNLETLLMYYNQFEGQMPSSISNCSALTDVELNNNNFTGKIPSSIGTLKNLYWFDVSHNQLEARTTSEWSFMDALTNCTILQLLDLEANQLQGVIPSSIANLSTDLNYLHLSYNPISGSIPAGMGRLTNLTTLGITETFIVGTIPIEIGNLWRLQELDLSKNMIRGVIPSTFGNLTRMNRLYLDNNAFEGSIPTELGNMKALELLNFTNNNLSGEIPKEIMNLTSLSSYIDLSNNYLNSSLSLEIGNLINIVVIILSNNRLSGKIPSTIDGCQELQNLYLDGNLFEGLIPSFLSNLKGIQQLDLSNNSFSGQVPEFIGTMNLRYLNISFNNFEGKLPEQGIFKNVSVVDVRGNPKLCGGVPEMHLPKCISETSTQKSHLKRIMEILFPIFGAFICFFVISCLLAFRHQRQSSRNLQVVSIITPHYKRVSYDEIHRATNGFSSEYLIGTGKFGAVYKAVMSFENVTTVAVKVLNLGQHGASRHFISECEALRHVKHRNLVKVLSSCSSIDNHGNDFNALIFEFMFNGSLETWLHPNLCTTRLFRSLSIIQRINIAIDVASALEYLHHHGSVPIVHCDLKPSNVLLDDDMTAHVGDFGLAKILIRTDNNAPFQPIASTDGIKGSVGYIPPEYGMGGTASEQGDIYSYGVLLLELFIGISPTNDRFKDGLNLHKFVEASFPNKIMDIIDSKLYINDEENSENVIKSFHDCLVLVIRCGLLCSKESPQERARIKEVIRDLNSARMKLQRQER